MFTGQTLVTKEPPNFKVVKNLGVISDTHVPKRAKCIPKRVFEIFQGADFIVHAGDLVELEVMDDLEQIAPVLAVRGNSDSLDIANTLPKLNTLKVFDWKIGVIHDQNILDGLNSMSEIAKANGFNVLVYGHTHVANVLWEGKILYLNPGSPTDPAGILNKPSVAVLKITRENISPQIITL
ncbi:MAG TPA: metallophosphoesterase family protein [Candidatus Bathyarchaeia archaeon]